MIDIGWQYCPSACYLVPYKLWGYVCLDTQFSAIHVLTNGNIFHLWSYDSCFSISHLCYSLAFNGFSWQSYMFKPKSVERMVCKSHLAIVACYFLELLSVVTFYNPLLSQPG